MFFSKCKLKSTKGEADEDLFLIAILRTLCNAPFMLLLIFDFKVNTIIAKKLYTGKDAWFDHYWCVPEDPCITDNIFRRMNEVKIEYFARENLYVDATRIMVARDTNDQHNPKVDPNYKEKYRLWFPLLGTKNQSILATINNQQEEEQSKLIVAAPPPAAARTSENSIHDIADDNEVVDDDDVSDVARIEMQEVQAALLVSINNIDDGVTDITIVPPVEEVPKRKTTKKQ